MDRHRVLPWQRAAPAFGAIRHRSHQSWLLGLIHISGIDMSTVVSLLVLTSMIGIMNNHSSRQRR
jgi:hypothetical protein